MFDRIKKTADSSLEQYIKGRRVVWSVARQLTANQLVQELAQAYYELESSLKTNTDNAKLKEYCRQYLHPSIHHFDVDVGMGIACRDIIYLIETGEAQLPADWFNALCFIEEKGLVQRVRDEVTHLPTPDEVREQKRAEQMAKMLEEDLRELDAELQRARVELAGAPKVQKASKESKVKELEGLIAKVKAEGKPLKSIHWVN